jgi:hypothetical protein
MSQTFQLTEFVRLTMHDELISRLDTAVERRRMCTLLGPRGSGKTWLLDYWRRQRPREPTKPRAHEMLYIKLRSDHGLAVPTVSQLYSKLYYAVQCLDRPAHLLELNKGANASEPAVPIYNLRHLQRLFPALIEKLGRRNIQAIIIDDAQYLDTTALNWLLDTRAYYDEQRGPRPVRALILAGERDTPAGQALLKRIKNDPEIQAAWSGHDIEMCHLTLAHFLEVMASIIGFNLRAQFGSDVNKQREIFELWKLAGGVRVQGEDKRWVERAGASWWVIEGIAEALDVELGPAEGSLRVITPEVIERVTKRLRREQ